MASNQDLKAMAKSRVAARKAVRGLEITELKQLIDNLGVAYAAQLKQHEAREEKARAAQIAKINAMLQETGLSPEDLRKITGKGKRAAGKKRKKLGKVPPKYRLLIDGTEYLWSGRGRPPKVFQEYFQAGNSKESCAI